MKKIKSPVFLITFFIALTISVSVPEGNLFAQQLNKTFEVPGGGGGTTTPSVDNSDNTAIYVIGGLVIAGIVVYAVLKNKRDKEKSKRDSTKASVEMNSFNDHLANYQKKIDTSPTIPFSLYLGTQREFIKRDEKRYYLGLSVSF